ncbi:uncharacterized protein TNIN_415561 [Trichonephila inaurata madagascariensis]|uniref:Uncharacterized protein n=1 Tax=Trichonephila inaurata madagascariensis TaxID=2747483 RepID=A0A8X7CHM9_9ARAC|nr:uncharacterized protein TNIN_415561 [Trichonephila inaurata madagascariensis]
MYQDLAAFYENPEVPNSFGGVEVLHHSLKGKYSKKDVKHWLSQKDAYTLHKLVRHKFQRNRVFVSDIDRQIGSGLTHYKGINFQKGYGSRGIFRRLFRAALPFLVKGGKTIGKEILRTGSRVASDVLSRNFFKAVKTRSRKWEKLAQKAIDRVQSMVGKGQYKRKRKKQKKIISSKARKMSVRDIFDS